MSGGTQLDARAPRAAVAAVVPFNPAKPLLQFQSSLLKFSAGNAATLLLRCQSSLLRLWADSAPKPLFQFQSSLLGLWADGCERAAGNFEASFDALEQQFERLVQNSPTRLSEDKPAERLGGPSGQYKPIIDQMADVADKAVGALAEKSRSVAANQATTGVANAPAVEEVSKTVSTAVNAGKKKDTKAPAKKTRAVQKAASRKRIATRTMKSGKKTRR